VIRIKAKDVGEAMRMLGQREEQPLVKVTAVADRFRVVIFHEEWDRPNHCRMAYRVAVDKVLPLWDVAAEVRDALNRLGTMQRAYDAGWRYDPQIFTEDCYSDESMYKSATAFLHKAQGLREVATLPRPRTEECYVTVRINSACAEGKTLDEIATYAQTAKEDQRQIAKAVGGEVRASVHREPCKMVFADGVERHITETGRSVLKEAP